MKKLFLLALLVLGVTTFAQAQAKEKVAVYVSGEIDSTCKKIISSKAISRISRSNEYVAMERMDAFLDALTAEQDYQLSGEVSYDQIVKLGMRFGVQYVAALEAICTNEFGFMTARLIDVESGRIVKSVDSSRKINSTEDWILLTNNVVYRLVSQKSN